MPLDPFAPAALPPDAALWIGAAGCGKTQAVIDEILYSRASGSGFRPIWALLASGAQVSSFRQRLLDASRDGVLFGVEFFNFDALYHRLLDRAGDPQHAINAAAQTHVLRRVIEQLHVEGALELFGPIARTPGFVAWVGRLVSELKQGLVAPEVYLQAAETRGPKDRDLARIYAGYQAFLRERHLVDGHGAGWVALEHLRAGAAPTDDVRLLVIDGFDQFNRLHVELLTALARQTERTILTLTQIEDARAPRFQRFVETRARLREAGGDLWRIEPIPNAECGRAAPLQHLLDSVFALSADPAPAQDALRLIEAPDVEREVSAVLRRVKRQLLDGTPPDTIAILARDLPRYSGALRETAHAYGVPLVVREGLPLRENPALAALLALIDLAALDFPRRDMLDVLRSPYLAPPGLDPEAVAELAQISQEQQVVRGREAWLAAARSSVRPPAEEDESAPATLPADRAGLADALAAWFDRVTPPAQGTLDELLRWIEALAGPDPEAEREARAEGEDLAPPAAARDHVNLLGQVRAAPDGAQVARDVLALRAFWDVLAGLRAAHALIDGAASAPIPWDDFRRELELALAQATVAPMGGMSRVGRVLATDVHEARGLPHDHVYLLGLAEGIFPATQPQADLHHDGERIELAEAGVHLRSPAERADDLSLFYQAIGLARRTLTLSRFTVDDAGAPVPPSPFWQAALRVLDVPPEARERIPLGAAPPLDLAATPSEAAVAASAHFETLLVRPDGPDAGPPLDGVTYLRGVPEAVLEELKVDGWTAYVGATHEDHHDLAACLHAVRAGAAWVGMIGAKSRAEGGRVADRQRASGGPQHRLRLSALPGADGSAAALCPGSAADHHAAVRAMPGEIEMKVVAVVAVRQRAEHRGEDRARALVHMAQEGALAGIAPPAFLDADPAAAGELLYPALCRGLGGRVQRPGRSHTQGLRRRSRRRTGLL